MTSRHPENRQPSAIIDLVAMVERHRRSRKSFKRRPAATQGLRDFETVGQFTPQSAAIPSGWETATGMVPNTQRSGRASVVRIVTPPPTGADKALIAGGGVLAGDRGVSPWGIYRRWRFVSLMPFAEVGGMARLPTTPREAKMAPVTQRGLTHSAGIVKAKKAPSLALAPYVGRSSFAPTSVGVVRHKRQA
jgi:hypothetical protein